MSVRLLSDHGLKQARVFDPILSSEELAALQQACAPVGLLNFPPPKTIRALRQHGYVEIVLGGLQITRHGLERLLRERRRRNEMGFEPL